MDVFTLTVDQDWTSYDPKENSILQFLGKSYDKDKQRTLYVFKLIGNPVEGIPTTEILWAT